MLAADLRIINLETAVTCCDVPAPKGINYRCHPANVGCLAAARIDCCVLANNHVLDWGETGLIETLEALDRCGLRRCGAGRDLDEAERPAILLLQEKRRVLVYALGAPSGGVPRSWAAAPGRPGVNLIGDYDQALDRLTERIAVDRSVGDIAIVSIHWGRNWGYDIPDEQRSLRPQLAPPQGHRDPP
jgi:poly-gamma-glutamate synthesis protein (capsule biosynthesis protein)